MAMFQVPPKGFRVVEELRIQSGIDDCQMRAAHAAWQGGHPVKVEFITNEVVDPICGVQVPGKEEHYSVLTGNGIRLLDWTAKNKADMFCIAAPGGKPFVVVDYNYHAKKGTAFVLEQIPDKIGSAPMARILESTNAVVAFDEDIPIGSLQGTLASQGYMVQVVHYSWNLNPSRGPRGGHVAMAFFQRECELVFCNHRAKYVAPIHSSITILKAGTPIDVVKTR